MNKKLQDYTGDPEASIVTELSFIRIDNKIEAVLYPCVYGKFKGKKRDGKLKDKYTTAPLQISHCPFCGEEYIKG